MTAMPGIAYTIALVFILQIVQGALVFRPPTRAQRLAAIGSTAKFPPSLRRAFDPGAAFQPIQKPGAFDWLANHEERGQTFEQFVASRPNRPDARRSKIYLLPLGKFGKDAPPLEDLRLFASVFFAMDVKLLPALDVSREALSQRRNAFTRNPQLLTTDILSLLKHRLPDDAFALLGITMIDLYPDPSWNYVFGQASLRDRVGVYSFVRYDPQFPGSGPAAANAAERSRLMLLRSCKILAHETCHMFGIEHCIWFQCLENGSNNLAEADARPLHLCPVDLRKLLWSTGFDVTQRYEKLLAFDRMACFDDEAAWLSERLRFIAP